MYVLCFFFRREREFDIIEVFNGLVILLGIVIFSTIDVELGLSGGDAYKISLEEITGTLGKGFGFVYVILGPSLELLESDLSILLREEKI